MKRTLTLFCLGLALSLTMVGCAQGSTPNVTPTPGAAVTTPGARSGMNSGSGDAGTMIRPGGSVGNTGSAAGAGRAARDFTDGVGDVARGVVDGVGDAARDIGNGMRDAVH